MRALLRANFGGNLDEQSDARGRAAAAESLLAKYGVERGKPASAEERAMADAMLDRYGIERTPPEPAPKRQGWKFASATLFVLGLTSTVAQVIAAATLGIPIQWGSGMWSTGGLVALTISIAMWVWCPSWASWRKWIWPPIAIIAVLAFVAVNMLVTIARAAEEEREAETAAQICAEWEDQIAELPDQIKDLEDEAADYAGLWLWHPDSGTSTKEDWSTFESTDSKKQKASAQAYYDARGGPQLEQQLEQLPVKYEASC